MALSFCFMLVSTLAFAVDETASISWEQDCVDGCPAATPPVGPVEEWRIYMGDASGVYDPTPIITIPYDGSPTPNYSADYILTLTGAGTKYFVVRSWNSNAPESGNSNEVSYPYNFAGSSTPVNVTFSIVPAP